ncbi:MULTISPECIES: cell division protein FtsL [unclassified Sulfitobacter]|jgi:cell division protein FtsL|uniref:cell division protein FtsL n=1 Tax=unclassified Sulfitobacter TaxID=196795 RepID=UPI0007C27DD7|nr:MULTISPECIES: cell division protein FtsL [unclassified Sulfitobacter]KZY03813.1 cell division protein FtsL [Sulfitobacter sp. HI0023]KZY24646.1 cell division protein FtsL [Sulfitobacter sp. HI0040]KZZ63713.1 cell division protein FtsL [Sulfitobacter sp. HI0129]MBO29444.1 cell division protein FtsL [Paracoccaceae bacterium]
MRAVLYILTALGVIGLAFWAYRENYATQQALSDADRLHANIRDAHARLAVLRAEWAYQNRPDRLRDLAELNFERLGLLPLHPDQFGLVDQIIYPAPPPLTITDPVDVSTMNADEEDPL